MNEQVLTISQMKELEELGMDISKASMLWIETYIDGTFIIPNDKDLELTISNNYSIKYPCIPTFTFYDIIKMLPNEIVTMTNTYNLNLRFHDNFLEYLIYDSNGQLDDYLNILDKNPAKTVMESAFNVLKFCFKNNYLKLKQ